MMLSRGGLVTLLGVLCVGLARAIPTLSGPTGLVALPDARIAAPLEAAGTLLDNADDRGINLRAVTGLGRGELGALYLIDDAHTTGANAKVRLFGDGRLLAVSAGAIYLDTDPVITSAGYLAVTVSAASRLSLTGGATWTRLSANGVDIDALRPFAGARLRMSSDLELVAEYQAKSGDLFEPEPITSLMLVRNAGGRINTTIGVTNAAGLLGTDDHTIFSGINIRL